MQSKILRMVIFLSTLPARGATGKAGGMLRRAKFLSTLPARGATGGKRTVRASRKIFIHAPREGSDDVQGGEVRRETYFYPRSPRGERLHHLAAINAHAGISIHAPREGSDEELDALPYDTFEFLSTLPARGATAQKPICSTSVTHFYPRSPRGERRCPQPTLWHSGNFYPRSPRGERLAECGLKINE